MRTLVLMAALLVGCGGNAHDAPGDGQTGTCTTCAMVGATCLDAGRFPTIRFVSKSVAATGAAGPNGGDLVLRGVLTLHGVARPFTVRVHLDVTGQLLAVTGATTLLQTDFGITPISKAGVVKVKDELALSWRISGRTP